MMFLTTKLKYPIAKIGLYLESQHIKYWKLFHQRNTNELNKQTNSPLVTSLQKNQIQARILKLLHQSELVDIKDFQFHLDVKKDLYLDSLALTVLFTAIEQQFNTIFDEEDDQNFEKAKNLGQVVQILMKDPAIV